MNVSDFINNYKEAFGENAPLPIMFTYSDESVADTKKIGGCFFKGLQRVRQGEAISLHAEVIGCGGGKFYTGFTGMPEFVANFVSLKEKYKETPQMVTDFVKMIDVRRTEKKYLNFMRIDSIDNFDDMEGLLFFATPDMLSGLATWAFFDCNEPDAVSSMFGSGCSSAVTYAVNENLHNGHRCFLGLFDPSVRPYVGENELSFVIPFCRFRTMYTTMRRCCLFDTPAWQKVKTRIQE